MSGAAASLVDPQPIDRPRTYDLIAQRLIGLIASSQLEPGAPIPTERELAAAYSVGRSSVREALRILESQGVLAPAPGGTLAVAEAPRPLTRSLRLVMTLTPAAGARELFELRRIIEVEAAGLAASRRRAAHLDHMHDAVAEMAAGLEAGAAARYIDADVRFHMAIAEATGNGLVVCCMDAIRDILREALLAIFEIPRSASRAVDEHRVILDAISERDAKRAAEATRAHLDRVESDLQQAAP
jgi:GntR family transcriptional regulator, transcriptional repressor for pyruvate dehydrogenase complex